MLPSIHTGILELSRKIQDLISPVFYSRVTNVRMLAHYTSFEALRSIVEAKEIWLSRAQDMNDIEEIRTGSAAASDALRTLGPSIFKTLPFDWLCAPTAYEKLRRELDQNTFIFSLSDHGRANESDRVAMWDLYGHGGRGVCVVFKKEKLLGQNASGQFPIHWSPMIYERTADLKDRIASVLGRVEAILAANKGLVRSVASSHVGAIVAAVVATEVLGYKHVSFEFEREVRFVRSAVLSNGPLPAGATTRIVRFQNVCKTVFVLPLRNYPEYGVEADLACLLDHIIVGPSNEQAELVAGVVDLLAENGLRHIPVQASDSPFRQRRR